MQAVRQAPHAAQKLIVTHLAGALEECVPPHGVRRAPQPRQAPDQLRAVEGVGAAQRGPRAAHHRVGERGRDRGVKLHGRPEQLREDARGQLRDPALRRCDLRLLGGERARGEGRY